MKKIILVILFCSISVFATDTDSFGQLNSVLMDWLNGNLGKLLALIGVMIFFLGILMEGISGGNTIRPALMKIGFIPLIAGGIVGIANTFFNMGITVF